MKNCKFCNTSIETKRLPDRLDGCELYICPNCGRYVIADYSTFNADKHKTMSYLFYNKNKNENWTYFLGSEEQFNQYLIDRNSNTEISLITNEMVENWFPKKFSEKIDLILLKLAELSHFEGDYVDIKPFAISLFFCDSTKTSTGIKVGRELDAQIDFILNFLSKEEYLSDRECYVIQLSAKALERVYELQKYYSSNKNVFVAMKFGKETDQLREKIKEGLVGFKVRIMDEIEHNHQIVPEMLYEIKNSKFVVAELSHHNNGAYYEAGFALGLGKEVIHICKKSELTNGLHFDVKQVNTIVYDDINEIPEKLKKRIKATIQE